MKNFIQEGCTLTLTAPYTVVAGAGALVGKFFGVAVNDVSSGAKGEFKMEGVFDLAKDTSTFSDGDPVYWDNTNKCATSTAQSNWLIGVATRINDVSVSTLALGGASGDATVRVRLNGTAARAFFKSSEQTGTGSSQNVAHGLGVTPSLVIFEYTDLTPATAGSAAVTEGTHDATNVVVTVTSGKKFKVIAYA